MQDRRILIVEDEQVVAMDVELQLSELGYEVSGIATTGEEALRLVEAARPDLVLMDIQLHGAMDGIAVAGQIRRCWHVPVVFVTAYANRNLVARAKEVEPYGYLTKPFTSKELDASIAIALQQHQLIRELFAEQGWLRTMLGSMNDGVIATDAAGTVKYLNSVAERLVGWTLGEANGLPIETVYSLRGLDDRPLEMCQLRLVLRSGKPIGRQRFILTTRNGRPVVVEDSASPVRDAKGKLAGAVAIIFDVTERQRVERERDHLLLELQRSNKDLEQFAYAIAHDLQGPIRTVKSFSDLLSRHLGRQLSSEDTDLLELMGNAASNMQRLIQALLEYARAGHGILERRELDLSEIVNSTQADLAGLLGETGAQIVCGPLPTVSADPVQLKQVLHNLIVNAVYYRSPERSPTILISGETTIDGWHIAVADNGQGISPENQRRVFELFARLHGNEIPGSGIGLALCRTIVERHGGRIWVEPNEPGQGTTFHFTISRLKEQAGASGRSQRGGVDVSRVRTENVSDASGTA